MVIELPEDENGDIKEGEITAFQRQFYRAADMAVDSYQGDVIDIEWK